MKTSSTEVLCDHCRNAIPAVLTGSTALYLSLKGQSVGRLKADFCNASCLAWWAMGRAPVPTPEEGTK